MTTSNEDATQDPSGAGECPPEQWRRVYGAKVWVNDRGDLRVCAEIDPPPIVVAKPERNQERDNG